MRRLDIDKRPSTEPPMTIWLTKRRQKPRPSDGPSDGMTGTVAHANGAPASAYNILCPSAGLVQWVVPARPTEVLCLASQAAARAMVRVVVAARRRAARLRVAM